MEVCQKNNEDEASTIFYLDIVIFQGFHFATYYIQSFKFGYILQCISILGYR